MSPLLRRLSLTFALALVAACGDDGGTGPGDDGDPNGEAMPVEERMAAITAVEAELAELSEAELEGDALNAAIAEFLEARPEFEAVGIDESSSVWARFTDGRLLIVVNNLQVMPADAGGVAGRTAGTREVGAPTAGGGRAAVTPPEAKPSFARPVRSTPQANEPLELPQGRQARLLHTFSAGSHFSNGSQDVIADMSLMLGAAGWTLRTNVADASVAGLRSISGDGFFYLNTHGGKGRTRIGTELDVYALQTSTLVTLLGEVDSLTKADLEAGRLVYMTAKNSETLLGVIDDWDTRYAITASFVEEYMSFSPNAFVFINACWSANTHSEVGSFIFAFQQAGASVYLGWTRSVGDAIAWQAAKYLTDRMTGANRHQPEASPHRPFPLVPVLERMDVLGLDEHGDSRLRAVPAALTGPGFGLLRPTIERVQIDTMLTGGGTLMMYGDFGSDPGQANRSVIMRDGGDVQLTVLSWTADSIRVAPVTSENAPGFTGDVVVIARGRESNPRRLHAWHGTATYVLDVQGSLELRIDMDIALRFDPDSTRPAPGDAAESNDHAQVFRSLPYPDLEARWTASGSWSPPDGCTTTWSGSGTLSSANPTAGRTYILDAWFDPLTRAFRLRQLLVVDQDGYTVTCDGSAQAPVSFTALMFLQEGTTDIWIPLDVDQQWRLVHEVLTFQGDGVTITFDWPAAEPMPAYDPRQPK